MEEIGASAIARCIAKALLTLHSSSGAKRTASTCWQLSSRRSKAVLVKLSTCGPFKLNTHCSDQIKDCAHAEGLKASILSHVGAYSEHRNMRQMGVMLTLLSKGRQREYNSSACCTWKGKQLIASHLFVHKSDCCYSRMWNIDRTLLNY